MSLQFPGHRGPSGTPRRRRPSLAVPPAHPRRPPPTFGPRGDLSSRRPVPVRRRHHRVGTTILNSRCREPQPSPRGAHGGPCASFLPRWATPTPFPPAPFSCCPPERHPALPGSPASLSSSGLGVARPGRSGALALSHVSPRGWGSLPLGVSAVCISNCRRLGGHTGTQPQLARALVLAGAAANKLTRWLLPLLRRRLPRLSVLMGGVYSRTGPSV